MTFRVGLGALLAFLLFAPVVLVAQSGSTAQPPVWRPAPETPPEDSSSDAPASTAPQSSDPSASAPAPTAPPATASLIERARDAAFQFSRKLPNFMCQEYVARYAQRGQDKQPLDIVSADVVYSNGEESYRNVKVGGRATNKGMMEMEGSRSTGEFASLLLALFATETNAQFKPGGRSVISGSIAQVYDFHVQKENSHWDVKAESQSIRPAYKGSLWVDPMTARVLRIGMEGIDLPPDFPMDKIETSVDYAFTTIAGHSSLLPVHAESLGCHRATPDCSHNIIDFRNYHEFKVEHTIK